MFKHPFDPKVLSQKSRSCAKFDPKIYDVSKIHHIFEDTPRDTEIQVSYLTISEYRNDGCLKISDFKHPSFCN